MLFEQTQTTGQTTTETQTTEDWLAKVVETKGESFKDVQVLAKSKLEADRYIKSLEDQVKQLREETVKSDYAEKILATLQSKAQAPTATTSDTKPEISEEVIKSLVEQTLTQREKQSTADQNVSKVQQELMAKYGTEAKAYVERRAAELGMSFERMSALAAESPSAFMALLGEPTKKDSKPLTQGSLNTASFQANPADRDWNYYQDLRRKNKALYYNPKTQQQMMQDKMRLGDKFGI
jgi:hypothetical protein